MCDVESLRIEISKHPAIPKQSNACALFKTFSCFNLHLEVHPFRPARMGALVLFRLKQCSLVKKRCLLSLTVKLFDATCFPSSKHRPQPFSPCKDTPWANVAFPIVGANDTSPRDHSILVGTFQLVSLGGLEREPRASLNTAWPLFSGFRYVMLEFPMCLIQHSRLEHHYQLCHVFMSQQCCMQCSVLFLPCHYYLYKPLRHNASGVKTVFVHSMSNPELILITVEHTTEMKALNLSRLVLIQHSWKPRSSIWSLWTWCSLKQN